MASRWGGGNVMFWGFGGKKDLSRTNLELYRPYTTRYDEIVTAASLLQESGLVTFPILEQLREPTPARFRATQRSTQFQSRYRAGHDLGSRPLFTLLIDHSGSMRGPKAMAAAVMADVAGAIFEHERVLFEILGFTTSSWRGGASRRLWQARGSPRSPGRLCDLRHIVYADAAQPDPRWTNALPLMLWPEVLKENVDGEALLWARDRALRLKPTAWVCVHLSDGVPMDDSTVLANGGEENGWYLYQHLAEAVAMLGGDPTIRLGCLSLDYDVGSYFPVSRRADVLDESAAVLFDLLEDLIWTPSSNDADPPLPGES